MSPTPSPVVVRLSNWVGEVLLSVPSIRLLQAHGLEPQLFGKAWARSLLGGEPWPLQPRAHGLRANIAALRDLRRRARLADPGFDARANTLLFTTSFSSAAEARLAGLRATGYRRDGRSLLLARALPARPFEEHALVKFWHLACDFLGVHAEPPAAIELATSAPDQQQAQALLDRNGIRPGFIAICPMAGGNLDKMHKVWPDFEGFAQRLRDFGRDVVACPGPGEEQALAAQYPHVASLRGVDLGTYGGILRRAALVVSNDTGPAHLAAAVGAPLLAVFGPTLPERWSPWGPNVHVEREWPAWPTVDTVLRRAEAMLAPPPQPQPGAGARSATSAGL